MVFDSVESLIKAMQVPDPEQVVIQRWPYLREAFVEAPTNQPGLGSLAWTCIVQGRVTSIQAWVTWEGPKKHTWEEVLAAIERRRYVLDDPWNLAGTCLEDFGVQP
ncbi:MAG: hypothetical protein E6Q97_31660 [Desulfurellales bacterium]|nr:MAG: hypothetical protein E6Q97_31660 [Desulfurellales bacterium]